MPISRTATLRAKSPRSPAATILSNVSTPKFMPPSHFADTAGYATLRQFANKDSSSQGEHVRLYGTPSGATGYSSKGTRRVADSSRSTHTPSDSEQSVLSNLEDHVPGLNELRGLQNGVSELEAQLLPSLRDTIERMTGGSSRQGTRTGRAPTRGTKGLAEPWCTPTVSDGHDHHVLRNYGSSIKQQTPIVSQHLTPDTASRSKTPTKPVLKSSLRSPSIKSPTTPVRIPSPSPLKSMKTLLTRKCSEKLRSPLNGYKPISPSQRESRSQGIEYPSSQNGESKIISTRARTPRGSHLSNIPRPRTRFQSDDSDFEHRIEVESRDRRKLTVTNAEVLLSESSSECSAETRNDDLSRVADVSRKKVVDFTSAPIGLGLSLPQSMVRESRGFPYSENKRYQNSNKNLRFSLPPSNSAESTYSDDLDNCNAFTNNGIESFFPSDVDPDLDYHQTRPSFPRGYGNIQESGNTQVPPSYQSLSQCHAVGPGAGGDKKGTRFECDDYSARQYGDSISRPSFREETFPDKYHDRGSRPRSSRQGTIPQGYTPDQEFPQCLKDLIKHRNSRSRLPSHQGEAEQLHDRATSNCRSPDDRRWNEKPATHRNATREADLPPFGVTQDHWKGQNSEKESFHTVSTRERLAFGIPPSESDEVYDKYLSEPELSQSNSDMSSITESIWKHTHEYADDLGGTPASAVQETSAESERVRTRKYGRDTTPRLNVISPTLSTESLNYEERQASINKDSGFKETWPNLRIPQTTEEYSEHPGLVDSPQTREGVIQEIFESEEELLHLLRLCMHLFVIPLRIQNSRTWITGVPLTVTRLLDWFDDIVHLHEQIYGGLCSARDTMSPATDRVSESLRWFVLRIEVYQPYLVKLADAKMEIQEARENQKNELGQFIRLQEASRECRGWTLERMLMLPVNRLASYQDLFARMLDLTPKTHQDYLSTLSLSRSIDVVLKVITEVKAREDEYNLLKEFSLQIQGLPIQNQLAARDRRLLHSGPLQLVISNISDGNGTSPAEAKRISRSFKLLDALAKSPCDLTKPVNSWKTGEGTTISAPIPSKVSWFSRLPLPRRSRAKSPREIPIVDDAPQTRSVALRTVDVHAFVFNDLVLLVQRNLGDVPDATWVLSDDIGVFRPLSIARLNKRSLQEGMILSLEVATVDHLGLNDTFNFRSSSWRTVDLLLRPPSSIGVLDEHVDIHSNDHFQPWLDALRQCCKHVLRNLTYISHPNQGDGSLGTDKLFDTHLVVSSLTASGLPIPRSPSGNFPDTCPDSAERAPGSSDEREERGWWSLRYQQVFREFQRRDSGSLDEEED